MVFAEARVPTDRADRYLVQFCRHTDQMSRMGHTTFARHGDGQQTPAVEGVESSGTTGSVRFPGGRCTLRAEPDALALRIEADDEDALRRIQDGITRRLETIGRRDQLTVRWRQPRSDEPLVDDQVVDQGVAPRATSGGRRYRMNVLAWLAVGVLAIAVHIGLLGGLLTVPRWGTWGLDAVLAIVLLKFMLIGARVIRGGVVRRRHRVFPHR